VKSKSLKPFQNLSIVSQKLNMLRFQFKLKSKLQLLYRISQINFSINHQSRLKITIMAQLLQQNKSKLRESLQLKSAYLHRDPLLQIKILKKMINYTMIYRNPFLQFIQIMFQERVLCPSKRLLLSSMLQREHSESQFLVILVSLMVKLQTIILIVL